MISSIDLNCDLGEGYGAWRLGDDRAMIGLVSSVNIACGFHAGSPSIILDTLKEAVQAGVAIGAHVSYPDLVGFGRRKMDIASVDLMADVIYQIGALQALAKVAGGQVSYIKPHGALYNTIAHDMRQAQAVIEAILAVDSGLPLVGLAGSPLLELARGQGVTILAEVFADRAYHSNGSLVARGEQGAVLHDALRVAERVVQLVQHGGVESIEGAFVSLEADTICLHGDTPNAILLAETVRQYLALHQIEVKSSLGLFV